MGTLYASGTDLREILKNVLKNSCIKKNIYNNLLDTSSTAQGSGGNLKNRKHIGEIGCCELRMAERIH